MVKKVNRIVNYNTDGDGRDYGGCRVQADAEKSHYPEVYKYWKRIRHDAHKAHRHRTEHYKHHCKYYKHGQSQAMDLAPGRVIICLRFQDRPAQRLKLKVRREVFPEILLYFTDYTFYAGGGMLV